MTTLKKCITKTYLLIVEKMTLNHCHFISDIIQPREFKFYYYANKCLYMGYRQKINENAKLKLMVVAFSLHTLSFLS